jgi:hypothetical protein
MKFRRQDSGVVIVTSHGLGGSGIGPLCKQVIFSNTFRQTLPAHSVLYNEYHGLGVVLTVL